MAERHTILLIQETSDYSTRTYFDFPCVNDSIVFLIKRFEKELFAAHPNDSKLTYTIADLKRYVNGIYDVAGLIRNNSTGDYETRSKTWFVEQVEKSVSSRQRR